MDSKLDPQGFSRRSWLKHAGGGACSLATVATLGAWSATAAHAQTKPLRLVTVGGAITEIAYLLGLGDQLVGTDTTSLYAPEALRTTKVGYMRQLSAEGLLSLKPDALITSTEAGPPVVLDQIRRAGVRVELVNAEHSWDEVLAKVAAVGRAAAREAQARALAVRLQAEWRDTLAHVAAYKGARPRVLFVLSHSGSPQVAGQQTAADAIIRYAGGQNVLQGFQGYRPMTAEAMASAAPDLILTSTQSLEAHGGIDRFWQRPELQLTPAWKRRTSGGLVHMDALELIGFGPRLPGTVRRLHDQMVRA